MDRKFSLETQNEVNAVLDNLKEWKKLFSINVDYFYEGWAIYLKEKSIYPRSIVIFKSYSVVITRLKVLKSILIKKKNFLKSFM